MSQWHKKAFRAGFFLISKESTLKHLEKNLKKIKKTLAIWESFVYTNPCCDMIAMKREVAANDGRFSVERMSS